MFYLHRKFNFQFSLSHVVSNFRFSINCFKCFASNLLSASNESYQIKSIINNVFRCIDFMTFTNFDQLFQIFRKRIESIKLSNAFHIEFIKRFKCFTHRINYAFSNDFIEIMRHALYSIKVN